MREGSDRWNKCTSKSEVCELKSAVLGNKYVLRLQVAMHDAADMAVMKSTEKLGCVRLMKENAFITAHPIKLFE